MLYRSDLRIDEPVILQILRIIQAEVEIVTESVDFGIFVHAKKKLDLFAEFTTSHSHVEEHVSQGGSYRAVLMGTKSCTKILILPKIFPTRFRFTFYGKMLPKNFQQDFISLFTSKNVA